MDRQAGEFIHIARWPGFSLGILTLLLTLFFAGMAGDMLRQLFVGTFASPLLAAVLASGFTILTVLMLITFVSMIGSVQLRFGPDALLRLRRYPFFTRSMVIPFAYVADVHLRFSFLTPFRRYYAVLIVLNDGQTIKVAGRLRGKPAALWLVHQVEMRLFRR